MYVSLWRENIPLATLRKESQLTLQRHRVSRAAALLRGLPSEPLAWEMLLSRVFWLQRVRQSLLRSVLLRSGGQPILHLSSSEWRQYSPIHPPQTYRIPSMLCYDNIKRNSFSIFGPWDTHRVKMRINGGHSKLLQSSENYEFQLSKKIAIQSQRRLMKVAPDKMKKSKMERCHKKAIRVSLWCLLSTTAIFT